MKIFLKIFIFLLIAAGSVSANDLRSLRFDPSMLKYVKAQSWSVTGQNITVSGGIHIPFNDMEIFADKAIINIQSQDIEAVGNVRFLRWASRETVVTADELARIQRTPDLVTEIRSVEGDIWGGQKLRVKLTGLTDNICAERLSGNLATGYFRFDDLHMKYMTFVCKAKSAERRPDGTIDAFDADLSSCTYLEHDNAHYSIGAKKIRLKPAETEFYGSGNIVKEPGDHAVLIYNGFAKVYGIPLLWLPVFYKPEDFSLKLFSTQFGKSGDWGYYIMMSRYFQLTDYPRSGFRVHGDYYLNRGFGYGLNGEIVSEQSKTDFFAYSIYDIRPYSSDDYEDYLLKIPHGRFDFRVSNITHITPRLDFRGAFEYSSDLYFVRDYFSTRFNANPQPATFAALEQQFDHFSASVMYRPRVNKFYTVSEKLPEVRLDIPRQQLFGTNFYYQGEFDSSYNSMKWIEFDFDTIRYKDKDGNRKTRKVRNELSDYKAYRFDTTHFLYFPIRLDWLTVIPRAGFKMTAYSNSSDRKITTNDLLNMFIAADPECVTSYKLKTYDDDGGARVRSLGELGFEASTKIHNTWNDVRIPAMKLDGLRHVMRPYVNYTYIGSPSVSRDHLFYFDDTDRIERQHFFRFGLENRLQTRAGDSSVRTFFSMENYWDLYLENADGFGYVEKFNRIGNFCTTLTASPLDRLTFRTSVIMDIGNNNDDMPTVTRRGRDVGRTGIRAKWLNRWNASLSYEIVDDVNLNISYDYRRPYSARSAYSMGSTLYQMDAGGYFDKFFKDYDETFSIGASFPLTPDKRTKAAAKFVYDIEDGSFGEISFMLIRAFHCWEVAAMLSFTRDADDDDHYWDTNFSVQARLIGLETPLIQRNNEMASEAVKAFNSGATSKRWQ